MTENFKLQQIDAAYINTLTDFINACRKYNVKIDKVFHLQNGYLITFPGLHADTICHDSSYGSPCYGGIVDDSQHHNDWSDTGCWETMGFPWDHNDVSTHTSEELAEMIGKYQKKL